MRGKFQFGSAVAVVVVVLVLVLAYFSPIFGYVGHGVGSNEIGVTLVGNKVAGVVGPGIWTDLQFFADIVDVKTEGIGFCVQDDEVLIQKAEQAIGVKVCGRIRRPGVEHNYASDWAQYRALYEHDVGLVGTPNTETNVSGSGVVFEVASQAMKVCVGDRTFEQSVVGSARDDLRLCIDNEMSKLAESYGGLIVENVTVPNVGLSDAAKVKMHQITEAKLQADLSRKEADKAAAEGEHQLAVEQAGIKVAQGKIQEEQRQFAITANLERLALEAKKVVIETQKANDLTAANLELEIQTAKKLAAEQTALAGLAALDAEAAIYTRNPRFASFKVALGYAQAYRGGEKMVVAEGTDIRLLLGGQAVVPFMNMNGEPAPN